MKLKTLALATAIALTPAIATAGDWSTPPAAEYPETFDTKQEAKQAFRDYKTGTLAGWLDRVTGWKNAKIDKNKDAIRDARAAKKAGDLTKEEFRELKAEKKERNKSLRTARKEARQAANAAKKDARQDAKSRVGGGGLSL